MDWLSCIIKAVKLPMKLISSIALLSGILLVLPIKLVLYFGIDDFIVNYKKYISMAFLTSISILIINIFLFMISKLKFVITNIRNKNKIKALNFLIQKKLQNLDSHEMVFLREFSLQAKNSIDLPMDASVVIGLERAGIIIKTGNLAQRTINGFFTSYEISELAKEHITLQTIGLHDGEPSQEEIKYVQEMRPDSIKLRQRFLNNFIR